MSYILNERNNETLDEAIKHYREGSMPRAIERDKVEKQ